MIVSTPTIASDHGHEQAEVVGGDDAEAFGVAVPEEDRRRTAAPTSPMMPSRADRHSLTRTAERFCAHGRQRGQGDAKHRDDGV